MTARKYGATRAIEPTPVGPGYPSFLAKGEGACATWPYPDDFTVEYSRTTEAEKDDETARQPRNGGAARQQRAKAVCYTCRFKTDCLDWALKVDAEGVYGGTTTKERRAYLAKR